MRVTNQVAIVQGMINCLASLLQCQAKTQESLRLRCSMTAMHWCLLNLCLANKQGLSQKVREEYPCHTNPRLKMLVWCLRHQLVQSQKVHGSLSRFQAMEMHRQTSASECLA